MNVINTGYPTKRLKHLVTLRRAHDAGRESERPYVGLENIEPWTGKLLSEAAGGLISSAQPNVRPLSNCFECGDVLFGKLRPYLAKAWVAEFSGSCTTEALVMEPHSIEPRFLRSVFLWPAFIEAVDASTFGSRMPRADWGFIGNIPIPAPERAAQVVIADYIDQETERLDKLVATKRRLLELLVEKRRSIISHKVHRGLDTTINTSLCRLKYLASINDDVLTEDNNPDFEMRYIDIGNVDSSGEISEPTIYRFGDAPSRARRLVEDGDVIISTVRTYLQAIAQICEPPDNLVVSTGFAVVRPRPDRFDPSYCRFALRDTDFIAEVERRSVGVSYPAINANDLADIPVSWYPLPEQRAIADYLDNEVRCLDALLAEVRGSLELLEERRLAVVSRVLGGGERISVQSAGNAG